VIKTLRGFMKIKIILSIFIIVMGMTTSQASFKMIIGLEANKGGSLSNGSINFRNKPTQTPQLPASEELAEGCYGELDKNYVTYVYNSEYIDYTLFENGKKVAQSRHSHDEVLDYLDLNGFRYTLYGDALRFSEEEDGVHVDVSFCKTKIVSTEPPVVVLPPLVEGCYGELNKNYVSYIYSSEYIDYTLFENGEKVAESRHSHDEVPDYLDINGFRYTLYGDPLEESTEDDGVHAVVSFCKVQL
jgi:hypothetical protein